MKHQTNFHINESEYRLLDILWDAQPVNSMKLAGLCLDQLGWKKSTTYTMLRRLCQRGIFQNREGLVSPLLSQAEFHGLQSEKFVEETFQGSLPAFLTAFTRRKKLTDQEIQALEELIRRKGEE